ncbi:MAG: hypothetical protein H6817_06285 [Phycisphaerales bacterium]|nr:hypothetical protein [Phycisphaerales bacterium]
MFTTFGSFLLIAFAALGEYPDISLVPFDLTVPAIEDCPPAPGKRVRHQLDTWRGTEVYHCLYLPADWQPGKRYPVIVEYPGNGPYHNKYGDVFTGKVEDCSLGFGLSGGSGYIWLTLPFVNAAEKRNQLYWWGDVDATVTYCRRAVAMVCAEFGGDANAVVLTGFSRGAIACNYIGLHDDEIAKLWCAFIPDSHYDGVRQWEYAESDRTSALRRLQRLNGRPVLILQEKSIDATRKYIADTGVAGDFTYQVVPYRNHSDRWVLQDVPARQFAREWLADAIKRVQTGAPSLHGAGSR